mmetsp:Transcript_84618/g.213397  ORF Transcript_84618/g.213397 Transcript_84618/m.213397 type:complete len:152 (-) Transcript_84618:164-619(-)
MAVTAGGVNRVRDGLTESTQHHLDHMTNRWPTSLEDGGTKIIIAKQKEDLNRSRGDFPAYERACGRSNEHTADVKTQCSRGVSVDEEFPLFAAAVRERKLKNGELPKYDPYTALTRELEANEPYCNLVSSQKDAHLESRKLEDGTRRIEGS